MKEGDFKIFDDIMTFDAYMIAERPMDKFELSIRLGERALWEMRLVLNAYRHMQSFTNKEDRIIYGIAYLVGRYGVNVMYEKSLDTSGNKHPKGGYDDSYRVFLEIGSVKFHNKEEEPIEL